MDDDAALAPLLLLAVAPLLLLARRRVRAWSARDSAGRRLLGLAAQETRLAGLAVRDHADTVKATDSERAAALAGTAWQLLSLADAMQEQARPPAGPRTLREQEVDLRALLSEAVASVAASIEPGRRVWKIFDRAGPILHADLRALRHVLVSTATEAARDTGPNDWIEFSLRPHPDGVAVVCEDEGRGVIASAPSGRADSRGIGLRLTLARALMEAHGGRLDVEAATHVGTRVSLVFPAARVVRG